MACYHVQFDKGDRAIITLPDDEGRIKLGRYTWRWDFHNFLGPSFFRVRRGGETFVENPPQEVWDAFGAWFKERKQRKEGVMPDA